MLAVVKVVSGATYLRRRPISSEPQPDRGDLDHGEEVGGKLVVGASTT